MNKKLLSKYYKKYSRIEDKYQKALGKLELEMTKDMNLRDAEGNLIQLELIWDSYGSGYIGFGAADFNHRKKVKLVQFDEIG